MKTPDIDLPVNDPTPAQVRAAREHLGMTQPDAADAAGLTNYQRWAEYERGVRSMDNMRWQWFLLRTNLHPTHRLTERRA